jgi:hypothetical protein
MGVDAHICRYTDTSEVSEVLTLLVGIRMDLLERLPEKFSSLMVAIANDFLGEFTFGASALRQNVHGSELSALASATIC